MGPRDARRARNRNRRIRERHYKICLIALTSSRSALCFPAVRSTAFHPFNLSVIGTRRGMHYWYLVPDRVSWVEVRLPKTGVHRARVRSNFWRFYSDFVEDENGGNADFPPCAVHWHDADGKRIASENAFPQRDGC